MGTGVFNTGVSGLIATQRSLAVASHNIANVNTEGYSRQRADLTTRDPQRLGNDFVGTGVRVADIRRLVDEFSALQIHNGHAGLEQASTYQTLASRVDNLIADPSAGLMPSLQTFFSAVQGVADAPASIPERQVLLSQARGLESRFHALDEQFRSIADDVNARLRSTIDEINGLSQSIARLNGDIVDAGNATGAAPNDLLDKREALIESLSKKVAVRVVKQSDGQINVSIGNGQPLVTAREARTLVAAEDLYDATRLGVAYETPQGPMDVTSQMQGGVLGGLIGFRQQILDPARNTLGKAAMGLAMSFNAQHRQGLDLDGQAGGDFFYPMDSGTSPVTPRALPASSNRGIPTAVLSLAVNDAGQLQASDYRLERKGGEYSLTRLSDGQVTRLSGFPSTPATIDGIEITLSSGAMADGDSFLLQPVRDAAKDLRVELTEARRIAAASPLSAAADLANAGQGTITDVAISDPAVYTKGRYTLTTATSTAAAAGGSVGVITDAGAANTLEYRLTINGTVVYSQNEVAAPLATLNDLASAINANQATTGVRATVDPASSRLYLTNDPTSGQGISIGETLVDTGGTPLDAGDRVTGYFGGVLDGTTPGTSLDLSPTPDAYLLADDGGTLVASGTMTLGQPVTAAGMTLTIAGAPATGDRFSVNPNAGGTGDNRNMLELAALEGRRIFDSGNSAIGDVYGQIVADVGNRTAQAAVNRDAQESLLNGAVARREQVSGVNLDEEAADILRLQQAYQASARVISTANSLFDTLMGIFR